MVAMLDASLARINPASASAQQTQKLTHAELDVQQAGLHASEPLHVRSAGILLHQLVRGVQSGGE
jgi:hypothetical protein